MVLERLLQRLDLHVVYNNPRVFHVPDGASKHEAHEGKHYVRQEDEAFDQWLAEEVKLTGAGGKHAVARGVDDADALVYLVGGLPSGERQANAHGDEAQADDDGVGRRLYAVEGAEERVHMLVPALIVPGIHEESQQEEDAQDYEEDGAHAEGDEDQGTGKGPEEVEVCHAQDGREHCSNQDHGPGVPEAACCGEVADPSQRPVDDILLERVVLTPLGHTVLAFVSLGGVRHLVRHAL
mmetsp:Transcript_64108/g.177886  ORF Transcript_64108/g.177886 Transcript_64108/m.177886 type:complete len:238 (-) Transcript_64108:343-1056(-)